jgi:hypothetical protein
MFRRCKIKKKAITIFEVHRKSGRFCRLQKFIYLEMSDLRFFNPPKRVDEI